MGNVPVCTSRGIARSACVGVALVIALGCFSAVAQSSEIGTAEIDLQREQLFQTMLARPDDLDVAFEYAALSAQAGDYEAAISTLERMLIFAPGLPRLQLELGVLYYRLGSYQSARSYFEAAISGPGVPPEVHEQVAPYLDAIARELDPVSKTAAAYFGVRWQSNANAAPGSRTIDLGGLPFTLDDEATRQADFSFFGIATAKMTYDLESQGDRLEAGFLGYTSFHFEQTQVDVQLAEVSIGPSFNLARFGISDSRLGVYGIANGVFLGHSKYFGTLGAGARVASRLAPATELAVGGEYRHRWYDANADRPTADDRTGPEYRGLVEVRHLFDTATVATLSGRLAHTDARVDYLDHWEAGAVLSIERMFDALPRFPSYPWAVSLTGGYLHRSFAAPDPVLDPTQSARDHEFWTTGALNIPLSSWAAIMPQVEYREVRSNYPTRDYEAFTAMLGVLIKY
jgi:hypothetical protein